MKSTLLREENESWRPEPLNPPLFLKNVAVWTFIGRDRVSHFLAILLNVFFGSNRMVLKKGPHGETAELFEEYRNLHESNPLSPFLRR